jgi:hypothetical protein
LVVVDVETVMVAACPTATFVMSVLSRPTATVNDDGLTTWMSGVDEVLEFELDPDPPLPN